MLKLKETLDKMFVEDWTQAWKWLSVQASLLFACISTYVMTYPDEFAKIVDHVPETYRPFVGILVAMFPLYLRLKKQAQAATEKKDG